MTGTRASFVKAPDGMNVAAAIREVRAKGSIPHVLDGTATDTAAGVLDAVSVALDFPERFGHNLDALYDCLTDLSWLEEGEHVLIWSRPSVLRRADRTAYDALGSVLSDAVTDGTGGRARLAILMLTD